MYLSRLRLDPRSACARRDLADPYDMHRTLVRAFVRDDAQTPPRFLWRLEPENAWLTPTVLVQSEDAPQWQVIEAMSGYLQSRAVDVKQIQLVRLVQLDAHCRFRLFANPTVARAGKRHGLASEAAQLDWLHRQGQRLGFAVEAALVTGKDVLRTRKAKGTVLVQLQRACFEGVLKVQNPDALIAAMRNGIGPGKAFGCGLLSVARIG